MERSSHPTGKILTQDQGISAMMTLARFCREHTGCSRCVFMGTSGPCMLKGSTPENWPAEMEREWKKKKEEQR